MSKPCARLTRRPGIKRYKRLFLVGTEGQCTEREYLEGCVRPIAPALVEVMVARGKKTRTAPKQTLSQLKEKARERSLGEFDQAWVVGDVDDWAAADLNELVEWSKEAPKGKFRRFVAISNPNFEYWLLLHFEEGANLRGPQDLKERLRRHLPNYNKHVSPADFPRERIEAAIRRAKEKDSGGESWPTSNGSHIYKLVEAILNSSDEEEVEKKG